MRGGYRKNAGRKQGFSAKNAEEARKLLSERLSQEIEPIADVLVSRAKEGDIRAIKELFDRAWGRAPQALEIEKEDKKLPIPIMWAFDDSVPPLEEMLQKYEFSREERAVLEKRLIPKRMLSDADMATLDKLLESNG